MTEKEAIRYLECFEEWNEDDEWLRRDIMEEFIECCTKALTEIQQYHEQNTYHWISVEERLPEEETSVWVTVKHSSWISDYGSDFIPKEEWEYHPESSGTHKGKYEEGIWWYEDEENEWIRCDEEPNEARDLGAVYDTVIAWQPLPEPYKPKEGEQI